MSPPTALRSATIHAFDVARRARVSALCAPCLLLPLSAALSGCGEKAPDFPPLCPAAGILRDAADLTQFRGTGTDLTDMVVEGRITGLGGKCALDDKTHLRTQVNINLELTRGPATSDRTAHVSYFIAVSKAGNILDKQVFGLTVQFDGNVDRLSMQTQEADLVLPIDDKLQGNAYSVLVGFQLTPQELEFNRQRGVR